MPIEIDVSWGMIYFVMAFPALLMLSNFVFGSCTVSEFVDEMSGKDKDLGGDEALKLSTAENPILTQNRKLAAQKKRTLGKLITTSIFVLLVVEPFIYLRFASYGRCDIAGAVFLGRSLTFGEEGCGLNALKFGLTWLCIMGLFISCIVSDASGGLSAKNKTLNKKDDDASTKGCDAESHHSSVHRCRTCNNSVPGHDHHCIFVNNCIGVANYKRFFMFVISAFVNTFYIFFSTCMELFERGEVHEIVLGLICYALFFGVTVLLSFHMLLIRKGITTAHLLKTRKGTWARIAYLLF